MTLEGLWLMAGSRGPRVSGWASVLLSFAMAACGASEPRESGTGGASQTGDENGQATYDRATAGGLDDECEVASTTAVAWTDQTELGTPEEVFAGLAGTCEAPFAWDGSGWSGTLTVEPATGQSTITATVDVDQSSARWVERRASASASALADYLCGASLELTATVTLELPEATVAQSQQTTISISGESPSATIQLSLAEADFGDWVAIVAADDATSVEMLIEMEPIGDACVGSITLFSETSSGNLGTGMAGGGFAEWSDTGCGVGQSSVNLDEPYQGVDLAAAVDDAFHEAELSGTWEDGGATVLSLDASIIQSEVCAEAFGGGTVVTIPVSIAASTEDNRVSSLSGTGTVRASVLDSGLPDLQVWLSTDLVCQSQDDTLAYRSVDCETVDSVTAQLGINQYGDDPKSHGGQLELYVYLRDSTASPGAADRVDRLQLSY